MDNFSSYSAMVVAAIWRAMFSQPSESIFNLLTCKLRKSKFCIQLEIKDAWEDWDCTTWRTHWFYRPEIAGIAKNLIMRHIPSYLKKVRGLLGTSQELTMNCKAMLLITTFNSLLGAWLDLILLIKLLHQFEATTTD